MNLHEDAAVRKNDGERKIAASCSTASESAEKIRDGRSEESEDPEYREKMEATMRDWALMMEREEKTVYLYDPVDKKHIPYASCKAKYGPDMAKKMLKARRENNGRLSPEDFSELKKQRNPSPRKEKTVEKAPGKTEPFIKIEHRVMRSEKARRILKKSMALYLYLRCYIVREKFGGDALNLFERYYEQGRLAASMSIRKLARDLDLDQKTVARFLRELSENRVLEIERIPAGEAFDRQEHNVYVLGRRDRDKNEVYYLDKIADNDA